jgi:hypothetical protein
MCGVHIIGWINILLYENAFQMLYIVFAGLKYAMSKHPNKQGMAMLAALKSPWRFRKTNLSEKASIRGLTMLCCQ